MVLWTTRYYINNKSKGVRDIIYTLCISLLIMYGISLLYVWEMWPDRCNIIYFEMYKLLSARKFIPIV